jgi:hypothetical protein
MTAYFRASRLASYQFATFKLISSTKGADLDDYDRIPISDDLTGW